MFKPNSYFSIIIFAIMTLPVMAQQRKQVLLDSYFNDEHMKNVYGQMISYHYKWNETDNNGFSTFKAAFKAAGATGITELHSPPDPDVLGSADVYIIVDPDTKKESPNPKYIVPDDVKVIADWVSKGGVLLLMANDSANVELKHFNTLAEKFGIHFNDDLRNHVKDDQHFEDGAFTIDSYNPVLITAKKIFMKDICSLTITPPASAALQDGDAVIIAISHFGKGTVIAVGDPWLYNEYTNGRLPKSFENDKAANDLTKWLIQQIPEKQR
jgi:unsaturated rhamnogalacturonyl hydrolase